MHSPLCKHTNSLSRQYFSKPFCGNVWLFKMLHANLSQIVSVGVGLRLCYYGMLFGQVFISFWNKSLFTYSICNWLTDLAVLLYQKCHIPYMAKVCDHHILMWFFAILNCCYKGSTRSDDAVSCIKWALWKHGFARGLWKISSVLHRGLTLTLMKEYRVHTKPSHPTSVPELTNTTVAEWAQILKATLVGVRGAAV